MLSEVDRHSLQRMADYVQVSYQNVSRIYSLSGEKIVAVREVSMNSGALLDPDQYVQSDGFKTFYRRLNEHKDKDHIPKIAVEGYTQYCLKTSLFRNLIIEEIDGRKMQVYEKFSPQDYQLLVDNSSISSSDFPIRIFWATFMS